MRDYRSRKTEVPSKRKFHHGRMAIVGRLVVLSVCMLVFGVTSTRAQTGQDSRCAGYSGQAHGLCTAAVAAGCFDGVQSPDCDALTANWHERCRACEGPAPWEVTCPCATFNGNAETVNAQFEEEYIVEPAQNTCTDEGNGTSIVRRSFDPFWRQDSILTLSTGLNSFGFGCTYVLRGADNSVIGTEIGGGNLSMAEDAACRADIRVVQDQLALQRHF
jgi:hypothetical protein